MKADPTQNATGRKPGLNRVAVWLILTVILCAVTMGLVPEKFNADSGWFKPAIIILVFSAVIALALMLLGQFLRWLFSPRHWGQKTFLIGSLITLIALFYAVEDWRGWHAWQVYEQAGNARGEHYDYASVVPAPVPDDQNFALTPVVYSCYGQMFDRQGHEVRPRNTNLVNRLSMPYTIDEGNLPFTNTLLGNWTIQTRTSFTNLAAYYRQIAPKTNLFPVPPEPGQPAADVLYALGKYDATIEELRDAAKLPYARFPLTYDKENCAAILLPHLAGLKGVAHILELRALAELQTGQPDRALADLALGQRATDSLRSEPFLISQLVRIAMQSILMQPVWEGLADHRWNDGQLVELDHILAGCDYLADYQHSLRGERGFHIQLIKYLRTSPQEYLNLMSDDNGQQNDPMVMLTHLIPAGWFWQNQVVSVRALDNYLPIANLATRAFQPSLARNIDETNQAMCRRPTPYNFLARLLVPALGGTSRKCAIIQSSVDLARVGVALERYRLANGNYPESLDPLSPKYIDAVPHDLIGGAPLHYRREPDGRFLLYSIGWNEKDDGGKQVFQNKSKFPDQAQGDWVWQYPAP